ncbi:HNH endonuclease [Winogradskyella phage Peternella_1]|uniref:HNH endonuclease n=1 Tax=Winogradskyella phage Peternella_1 TaxID=2745699 RepID=A0A8E4ZE19_9CAUD|nr:HNH endonuclease [Winogradskyella phage Peternella_1]QQV91552.1 HNH endonuclease [Winogradskyella phage Peternella_1]
MSRFKLTQEHKTFIIKNYKTKSRRVMARELNIGVTPINTFMKKEGLKVSKKQSLKFRSIAMTGRTTFTTEEDLFIEQNYLTMPIKTMASHINRSYTGIEGRLKALNLQLPTDLIEQRKRASQFQPGDAPMNKGLRQEQYMSAAAIKKAKATQFKKGAQPHNALPVGAEVLRKDTSGRVYVLVKLKGKRHLQLKQRVVWEAHHGKIPPKHNIVFKDDNTQNLDISNLECVSDADLMKRNSLNNYPQHLKELIHLKAAINRKINQINKTV